MPDELVPPDSDPDFDVAVVGAGPAGLAATAEAAAAGARVLLVDAGQQFGGQYWRHSTGREDDERFHHSWTTYQKLARTVDDGIASGAVTYRPRTHVWSIAHDPADDGDRRGVRSGPTGFALHLTPVSESARPASSSQRPVPKALGSSESTPSSMSICRSRALVLCAGAYDRQLPIPGWTLPGVMAAGGVQAFIKTQHISPGRRILLAGTGPFLLSAAASVLQAGGEVAGICESNDLTGWFPRGASVALVPSKGVEGAEFAALLARHRVPFWRRAAVTAIHGGAHVESATVTRLDRRGHALPSTDHTIDDVDVVGLGWGFVPQVELLLQLGAATRVDDDGSLVGVVDRHQAADVPGLYLAGEVTGVAGAAAAVAEGRIAGRAAAGRSGRRATLRERFNRSVHREFARTMHGAHPLPQGWHDWLDEGTVICRCEEVSWERVREAIDDLDAADPRSLKGATRTGMGWCQGRLCGAAASCVTNLTTKASVGSGDDRGNERPQAGRSRTQGSSAKTAAPGRPAESTATAPDAAQHDALISIGKRPIASPLRFHDLIDEEG